MITIWLIIVVAILCFIAAAIAIYGFTILGTSAIGIDICLGLSLIAISWIMFSTVAIESYNENVVDAGLAVKIFGMLFLIRGFWRLKVWAENALHINGTIH